MADPMYFWPNDHRASPANALREQRRQLMNHPAYFDTAHSDHQKIVQRAATLTERIAAHDAAQARAPVIHAPISKAELQAFMAANAEALFNRDHPQHQEVAAQSRALSERVQEDAP